MSQETDPLHRETSVSAEMTETGLQAKTNSRWISAADRLIGNFFDYFNPALERRARLQRAKTDGEVALIEAVAKAGTELLGRDPAASQSLLEGHFSGVVRKQINKEAVLIEAFEELQNDAIEGKMQAEESPEAPVELDADWLNYFESYAEKATSENMRVLWGRILAGEIRRPSSFSLTTLRIVAELNKATAEAFQDLARHRVGGDFILITDKPEMTRLLMVQAAGLCEGAGGIGMFLTTSMNEQGWAAVLVGDDVLQVEFKEGKKNVQIPGFPLTQAGQELAQFLPLDSTDTIDRLVSLLTPIAKRITLHASLGGLQFSAVAKATLHPKAEPPQPPLNSD